LQSSLLTKTAANKACSGQVGFVAVFKHFSGFGFFLLPNIISARPLATNASRSAAARKIKFAKNQTEEREFLYDEQ